MILQNKILQLLCATIAVCALSQTKSAISTEAGPALLKLVGDGLELRQMRINENKKLTFLQVSLKKFDVRVLTARVPISSSNQKSPEIFATYERAPRGYFLQDYQRRYNAIAALSGGYIETFSPPTALGFIKSNGTVTDAMHKSWLTDGIFCSDKGSASIWQIDEASDAVNMRDCLQAGPLLIYRGRVFGNGIDIQNSGFKKLARSVQAQGFVCIDKEGFVLLGISDAIDLSSFVEILRSPPINCIDALRLTGKETAGLRVADEFLFGKDEYLFPSALAIISR